VGGGIATTADEACAAAYAHRRARSRRVQTFNPHHQLHVLCTERGCVICWESASAASNVLVSVVRFSCTAWSAAWLFPCYGDGVLDCRYERGIDVGVVISQSERHTVLSKWRPNRGP
jgi:hypothetical protein